MFSSIQIKKFRSCANVRLESIGDILVLIGRNGAGKTNILKAIAWACDFASRSEMAPRGAQSRTMNSMSGNIDFTFTIDKVTYRYQLNSQKGSYREINGVMSRDAGMLHEDVSILSKAGKWTSLITRRDEKLTLHSVSHFPNTRNLEISALAPCLVALQSLLPESDYYRDISEKLIIFFSTVRYYPLHNYDDSNDDNVIFHEAYQKWLLEKFPENNSRTSLLYKIIDLELNFPEKFSELKSLLGEDGLGLINDITVITQPISTHEDNNSSKELKRFHMVFFTPTNDTERAFFRFDDLSFGTKRILYLLVAMLYDGTSVSLLEQPEDGVHVGLVEKLIPLFQAYSENCQFIIASHSTAVLNNVTPDVVRMVAMEKGSTSARALDESEKEAAEEFLQENGPLSDFFESIVEN